MTLLTAGTVIAGRYRVEAILGQGGMGVVYRAVQLPLERPVALKVLRRDLLSSPNARARFEREARVASALPHASAVTIHDFGEHEGTAYLAMELLEGETLRAAIDRRPDDAAAPTGMTASLSIALAQQLADILAAAHQVGLVHRDLTPSNIVLEPRDEPSATDPRVRVLDFGLAFLAEPGPAGRMTREGVVVGTPEYLSPEQARGEELGPPTDVYALGCVLHEMLTGHRLFTGTEMEVLTKQMFAPAPALARDGAPSSVPAALDALRRAMLDKSPERRPDAREVRDRLAAMDPDADRGRVRARQDGFLGARAVRMVDAASGTPHRRAEALEVAILGVIDPALLLGLSANGLAPFVVSETEAVGPETMAVYAPSIGEDEVRALASGPPLVVDADRGDMARLVGLMRAGAADVVLRPVGAAELARKLLRVARDRTRRR